MLLEVIDLRKSYGSLEVLRGVDLVVERGEILSLLGVNGAGKTTLLSIVCGLLRSDTGTVRVNGHDVRLKPRESKLNIGLANQDIAVYPVLTVHENLRFFGELRGSRRLELRAEIDAVVAALQLERYLDRPVSPLSGGEKRRLHTAIALLGNRPLLLLDEPTAGADVETRNAFLDVVKSKAAEGTAILYTTHYLSEVAALDSSVAILHEGRVAASGPLSQLVSAHAQTVVEVAYERAPKEPIPGALSVDELRFRIPTDDAGTVMRDVSRSVDAAMVRSIEVVPPSLEAVFLSITGGRFGGDATADTSVGSS